jgi:hypothetical protein
MCTLAFTDGSMDEEREILAFSALLNAEGEVPRVEDFRVLRNDNEYDPERASVY